MRVGLHTGPVMSGVVGQQMPRFCLLGSTMTVADKVQSMARAGGIVASQDFVAMLGGQLAGGDRGKGAPDWVAGGTGEGKESNGME